MRACLQVLLCTLLVLPAFAASVHTVDQAADRVEQLLLPQGKDNVVLKVWGPIPAGTEIRGTKELAMIAPAEGYAVYIDDHPTANLFHSVRYAFVNASTGEVASVDALSPPLNFEDYRVIETAIGLRLMAAPNRRAPLGQAAPPPTRADRWAVLMNGGYNSGNNHVRYWNDLSNIYITLNWTYNFADDHIIVLCSDGLDPAPDQSNGQNSDPDLDGDGDPDIMFSCVLANVDMVFSQLTTLLTPDDKLFVFTTDHGSSAGGWNTIQNLWNMEELTDAHFAALLAALPQCEIICTFEPCYSGGFLDDVVVPPGPRVASSACRYDQVSWAMSNLIYDEYVFHWTAAVKGEDAFGVPVDADYNGDGVITMDEAFRYAELHDQQSEDPQYDDYPENVGIGISLWPTGSGPFLVASELAIDDVGGNNNGAADPGETISMVVTLSNVGNGTAYNIVGTLSSTDPYLTITQNVSYYPDLGHFEQGQGSPPYMLDISSTCPQGQLVSCDLHIEADSAYTNDVVISFTVGDPMYDPVGPDTYGYYAFDPYDQPEFPQYDWVEISADSGGPGTQVPFINDDQVFQYALPFSFQYYGATYDTFTVATNGWIAMGMVTEEDYNNSGIPDPDGPPNMIAPYWEDLSPQRANSGKVWRWFDAAEHRLIVEYNHVEQYAPTGSFETFQVILLDPAYYQTPTGDGRILFQYKEMSATAQSEGTVGIENLAETDGLQYLFDGSYDVHAHPIEDQFVILFTTVSGMPDVVVTLTPYNPPIQIPAMGGSFDYNIAVANNEPTQEIGDVWCMVTLPNGSSYGPVLGPANLTLPPGFSGDRDRTQNVPGNAPAGTYSYNGYTGIYPSVIWSSDSFTFEKLTTGAGMFVENWTNYGEEFVDWFATADNTAIPEVYSLDQNYPNPFNPLTSIRFGLPQAGHVKLAVYDLLGRQVALLVDGQREAGVHEVTFDGSKLASGVYVYHLQSGGFTANEKMVLMK